MRARENKGPVRDKGKENLSNAKQEMFLLRGDAFSRRSWSRHFFIVVCYFLLFIFLLFGVYIGVEIARFVAMRVA